MGGEGGRGPQYRAVDSAHITEEGGAPPALPSGESGGRGDWRGPPSLEASGSSCGGGAPFPPSLFPGSFQWLFPTFLRASFRAIVKNQERFPVEQLRATFPTIFWLCFYKYLRLPRV